MISVLGNLLRESLEEQEFIKICEEIACNSKAYVNLEKEYKLSSRKCMNIITCNSNICTKTYRNDNEPEIIRYEKHEKL